MNLFTNIKNFFAKYRHARRSGLTVRYMFPAVLSTAAAVGLLALTATSDGSYAFLETPSKAVEVGELFPVGVKVQAAEAINAVEMTISFPKDSVEVFSVDRGQSVITIWAMDPEVTAATVKLSGGTFKRGFIGTHEIASIDFRALNRGQYDITLEEVRFVAGDGEGTIVPAAEHPDRALTIFNFDENTSPDDISVAVAKRINTDLNEDGRVSLQDISAFMGAWSSKTRTFDFNGDGKMTFRDFSIILADFFLQ